VGLDDIDSFMEEAMRPPDEEDRIFIDLGDETWEDVEEDDNELLNFCGETPEQTLLRKARLRATVV
jgi:hypothetical protein